MRRIAILCIGAVACAAAAAGPASAQVQPAGTGEPAFTNSAQNTQWFEWGASSGIGSYRVRFDYYENNTLVANPTQNPAPNGATNVWANWSGVRALQHGGQYGVCAQGQYTFPNDSLWISDGPNSCSMGTMLGRRAYTTIDRSKPTASVQLAMGAGFVKDTKIPLRIDFADDVAGPFPANFLCFEVGGAPNNLCDASAGKIYGYNTACSVPGSAGKSTTFSCTADFGAIPDGTVWACVRAADASIPDNPNGPNQTGTADKANLSDPNCDGVVVDRTAPAVAIGVASTAVKVGDLVSFQATASDATSGLAGAAQWTWGDNTGAGSGDAVAHTYTQPGTYEVALTVTDAAGNTAVAKKAITVSAPTTGGGGGTTTPPPTTPPPPANEDDEAEAPSIALDAPRSARARAKSIPVEVTASASGRVQLALMRGSRVIARASVKLAADGTADYRLKLPRNTKAGRYTLKATYGAASASRRLTLTGKVSARTSSRPEAAVGAGPRALPDGAFHGARPARTFKAV